MRVFDVESHTVRKVVAVECCRELMVEFLARASLPGRDIVGMEDSVLECGCEEECAPASVTPDLDGHARLLVLDQPVEICRLVKAQ